MAELYDAARGRTRTDRLDSQGSRGIALQRCAFRFPTSSRKAMPAEREREGERERERDPGSRVVQRRGTFLHSLTSSPANFISAERPSSTPKLDRRNLRRRNYLASRVKGIAALARSRSRSLSLSLSRTHIVAFPWARTCKLTCLGIVNRNRVIPFYILCVGPSVRTRRPLKISSAASPFLSLSLSLARAKLCGFLRG